MRSGSSLSHPQKLNQIGGDFLTPVHYILTVMDTFHTPKDMAKARSEVTHPGKLTTGLKPGTYANFD